MAIFLPKWRNFAKSGHTGWGSQQLTGDEVSYLPISQTNLVISLRALSPLFKYFKNKTAYQLGRYKPSSHAT